MKNIIVWFRKDLRIHDNPALFQASLEGNIIPVFIWSQEEEQAYQANSASLSWLHHALKSLEEKLSELGLELIYRLGNSLENLQDLIKETGAEALLFNRRYESHIVQRDQRISEILQAENVQVRSFDTYLLYDPYDIKNKQGTPYKVFTPFYKSLLQTPVTRPVPYPDVTKEGKNGFKGLTLGDLNLLPKTSWDEKFYAHWRPGEDGAIERFEAFAEDGLKHYDKGRDIPSEDSVSLLSPYLAWGNISVRAVWYAVERKYDTDPAHVKSFDAFKRQLIWRDFAYYQLIHFPDITHKPLREQFEAFPWLENDKAFDQWKEGMTGYPLVDAGMRQLMETGVIHNRVRMLVASFLIKHLLINWTRGYNWFREALVDFDEANNALGWQWVAGSGVETAPYFRIFNPILQSEKFDKHGDYIKRWVPELKDLPEKYIHEPWKAPEEVLKQASIVLDTTYPRPIVDHATARKRALAAFDQIKNN